MTLDFLKTCGPKNPLYEAIALRILEDLPELEREVARRYYGEAESADIIAGALGVTTEFVRQVKTSVKASFSARCTAQSLGYE